MGAYPSSSDLAKADYRVLVQAREGVLKGMAMTKVSNYDAAIHDALVQETYENRCESYGKWGV